MLIENCEFEGKFSGGVGGAIAATHVSDLGIKDSKFKSNAASLEIDCPGDILPDDAQRFEEQFTITESLTLMDQCS